MSVTDKLSLVSYTLNEIFKFKYRMLPYYGKQISSQSTGSKFTGASSKLINIIIVTLLRLAIEFKD
jgi:hypothetical protein